MSNQTPLSRPCEFSPDKLWRYTLWRFWDKPLGRPQTCWKCDGWGYSVDGKPGESCRLCETTGLIPDRWSQYLAVIGLNPSTADDTQNDPTITRCIDFAKRWGFGSLCMLNLFAYRATDPEVMKAFKRPVGLLNDARILDNARAAGMVLAAWGEHGGHLQRAHKVVKMLRDYDVPMYCLQMNASGAPKHPLYIKSDTIPLPYNPPLPE